MGDGSITDRVMRESAERRAALKALIEQAPTPPTHQLLCLEHTLYSPVQLNPARDADWLKILRWEHVQFDAHCVHCGRHTTFKTLTDRTDEEVERTAKAATFNNPAKVKFQRLKLEEGQFALHLGCSRNERHLYSFFFYYEETRAILTKIGQTPSIEDVAGSDLDRYRKILGSDFSELRKATGLHAHGIGIGAFIYLRRIFERLIDDARVTAGMDAGEFNLKTMSERVHALASHLPEAVVRYKAAWSILSKGVHELSEDECKRLFPTIRAAIIMMLEQRYEADQKRKAADDLEREFRSIEASLREKSA